MEQNTRFSHAYILAAAPDVGYARATELAQAMLCTGTGPRPCGSCRSCRKIAHGAHPDVITVTRPLDEKGKPKAEIYVDQIRDMAADAAVMPSGAEKKVYIIRDAGRMNAAAQNAALKLLEEPPAFDAFVLVADSAEQLLETVRSRCVLLTDNAGEPAPPAAARERAERWLDCAAGRARLSLLSFAGENEGLTNAELLDFCRAGKALLADTLCRRLPDRKLPRAELMRLARLLRKTEDYLRLNVSPKHVLGMLAAETIK